MTNAESRIEYLNEISQQHGDKIENIELKIVVTDSKVEQQIQEGLRNIKTLQELESEKQIANLKGKIDQLENEVLTRTQEM